MSFLSTIKRLLVPIQAAKFHYSIWFFGNIYDTSMGILEPIFTAWILASVVAKDLGSFYMAIAVFAGAKIFQQIVGFVMEFSKSRSINGIEVHIEAKFFQKFIFFENTHAEKYGTGKIISLSTKWVWQWIAVVMDVVPQIFSQVIMILTGFIIVGLNIPVSYLVFILVLFIGNVAITIFAQRKVSTTRAAWSQMNREVDRKRTQITMSKFEILQNNKISRELGRLSEMIREMGEFWIRSIRITASFDSLAILGTNILHIGIYLVIGLGVIRWEYSLATLILLAGIVFNLLSYVWGVQRTLGKFFDSFVHVSQLWEVMDTTPIIREIPWQKDFNYQHGNISLKNISFWYTKENPVFSDFSLSLEWGKKYAFVGPSGGGKTTLVKLLAGYITPDAGDIYIDHQSLEQISLTSYYRHIGYLTQDPSVFDGTIRENLVYALSDTQLKEDIEHEIERVLKLAKCEFIFSFEKGLDTEIWERGVRLSGGQKQRLAIAKIMLKNPEIVFLGEPTSALDSFNEEEVTVALWNLFMWRTVIVVAHRLQTVKAADIIFYIENGQVIESWSHLTLIEQNGKYKKMLDLQSGF